MKKKFSCVMAWILIVYGIIPLIATILVAVGADGTGLAKPSNSFSMVINDAGLYSFFICIVSAIVIFLIIQSIPI